MTKWSIVNPRYICIGLGTIVAKSNADTCETDHNARSANDILYCKYLIIGNSVAASAAFHEIIKLDRSNSIILLNSDKSLEFEHKKIHFEQPRVHLLNSEPVAVDSMNRTVSLSNGDSLKFDKCLLASGRVTVRYRSRYVDDFSFTDVYDARNKNDIQNVKNIVSNGGHASIIGSDWNAIALAIQLNSDARNKGFHGAVSLVMPGSGPLGGVVPKYLSLAISRRLTSRGIEVIPFSQLRFIGSSDTLPLDILGRVANSSSAPKLAVYTSKTFDSLATSVFSTDAVVLGSADDLSQKHLSSRRGLHYLQRSDLELDAAGSIIANRFLEASPDIFVAGDIASIFHCTLGRISFSGEDHNVTSGLIAARNMVGARLPYDHLPLEMCSAPQMGLYLASLGFCSSALESYGYWWKVPVAATAVTSTDVADTDPEPAPSIVNTPTSTPSSAQQSSRKLPASKATGRDVISTSEVKSFSTQLLEAVTYTTKKRYSSDSSSANPRGKLSLRKVSPNYDISMDDVGEKHPLPPLGVGVVMYMMGDVVTGICMNGLANQNAVDKARSRCHELIGKPISVIPDKSTGLFMSPITGQAVGERVYRNQTLGLLASSIVDGLVVTADSLAEDSHVGSFADSAVNALSFASVSCRASSATPLRASFGAAVQRHSQPQVTVSSAQEQRSLRKRSTWASCCRGDFETANGPHN